MNTPNDTPTASADHDGTLASDIDPRFDPAASGGDDGAVAPVRPAQEQLEEIVAACNAWVRDKPLQALSVAAGLGFLLGRIGR